MILIFTPKTTSRVVYSFKHIVEQMLGIPIEFTQTIELFIAHKGPKMTYAKQPLGNEFFILSHDLLFEQGITETDITVYDWDGVPCFFPTAEASALPFDVFAASFYLLSRYEEYFPQKRDAHGRFPALESLAHKHHFLDIPVIDIWISRLENALKKKFPKVEFARKSFAYLPLVDFSEAYRYKYKGMWRNLTGTIEDLFRLRFTAIWHRYKVLFNLMEDPYNAIPFIEDQKSLYGGEPKILFALAERNLYNRGLSPYSRFYQSFIKGVADTFEVFLKASYNTLNQSHLLRIERDFLHELLHKEVTSVRQHMNRLILPETYRHLAELDFSHDYTMGYYNRLGFRAGTSVPFYFYDIGQEMVLPIMIHPVYATDLALLRLGDNKVIRENLFAVGSKLREVRGEFLLVFHNFMLATEKESKGFRQLYVDLAKNFG